MAGHFKLLPVLLLVLFTFSVSGQLIASIDCGGTEVSTDVNLITWSPDDTSMVSNGVSRAVQPAYSISKVLDTLRVFTTRKKNCYSVGVTPGEKVLVRATFNYGNYDGLLSPPTFDLHLDGNLWTPVETSTSELKRYEAIFLAKRDQVSVCLAKTNPGQFPFISSLAIRSVDADVYKEVDEDRALFLVSRRSYGASENTRYPNDRYDRIWESSPAVGGIQQVTNDAIFIDTTAPNNPPTGIFANAITIDSTTDTIIFAQIRPSFPPLYINMYFSEVSSLGSTETRSFRIYETTTLESSPIQLPITPPYMKVAERYLYNYKVTSNTNISLVATADSDLPPLINALETFVISDVLTDGTNSDDVKALSLLQSTFDLLKEWRGDPCLPAGYSWDWLSCSNDTASPPRVTSLHLDSLGLSGLLPDISSMSALEFIDMHNNSLIGTIPSFLGAMPNLRQLNLADNQFSGSIPTSISNNDKLRLTVTGNPSLCTSGKSCSSTPATINSSPGNTDRARKKKKKSNMLPLILGIAIPIFLLIWVAVGVFIVIYKRKKPMPAAITRGVEANNGNTNAVQNIDEEMVNVKQQTSI